MTKVSLMCRAIGAAVVLLSVSASAHAEVVSAWNFNASTLAASEGNGTCGPVGGVSYTFATGAPTDTGAPNQALNTAAYPAQGTGGGGAGVEFRASTVGASDIVVSWEQRASSTASRFFQFEYSTDGKTFLTAGLGEAGLLEASGSDLWMTRSLDLRAISEVNNNPDFAFRLVAVYAPGTNTFAPARPTSSYSSAGTQRFDLIRIQSVPVPAPGAAALLVLAGLIGRTR